MARKRAALKAAQSVSSEPSLTGGNTEGGTTQTGGATAAGAKADDRIVVTRSSSSGTETSFEESVDEEKLLCAAPSQEMEVETGLAPSCSAEASTSNAPAGQKRKSESGPTPPQTSRKKRQRRPMLGATFQQAEKDDLLGVVLVKDQPYKILTRTQINWVRGQLLSKLVDVAGAEDVVPTFQESGIRHNRFHLSCTDRVSYDWLHSTVASLTLESESDGKSLQLELVCASEVPKLLRAEVYISGPPLGVPKFITLIKAQNRGLHTDRWVLRHQQTTAGGLKY